MPKQTLPGLTEDMITKINEAVESVVASTGFGEVVIVIEKGMPQWVRPSPSYPLTPASPPGPGEKRV
jgi:hypothetical protein